MSDDPQSKKIGVDAETAQQSINQLRGDPNAMTKIQSLEVDSDWGDSEYLTEFCNIFSETIAYVGSIVTATDEYSNEMADSIEQAAQDMHAADRAAAEAAARLLQELEDSQAGVDLIAVGDGMAESLPDPARDASVTKSDIAAIMQGGYGENTGSSSHGGGGKF